MNSLDVLQLIDKIAAQIISDNPKIEQLQPKLNYLKLLFSDEINLAENLEWPEWAIYKGSKEKEWFRKALYRSFDGRCFWTGTRLKYSDMEIDHIIPKKKGGPDNFLNYVPCSKKINRKKSDSLNTNRKLVAVLYYVEAVFGEKLKGEIHQFREEANRTKEKKKREILNRRKELLHIKIAKKSRPKIFLNFWDDYEIEIKEKLKTKKARDKLQAFFQVLGPIFKKGNIRNILWERFNLEIANCSGPSWNKIINETGFNCYSSNCPQAVVDALREIGIRGGRKRLPYDEIKQMDIFFMKKYIKLTRFDEVVQESIYRSPDSWDEGLNEELAEVMNRLAELLGYANSH